MNLAGTSLSLYSTTTGKGLDPGTRIHPMPVIGGEHTASSLKNTERKTHLKIHTVSGLPPSFSRPRCESVSALCLASRRIIRQWSCKKCIYVNKYSNREQVKMCPGDVGRNSKRLCQLRLARYYV